MSQPAHKKKFGSEFLCKTRYRNTLPLPPFAPKLLALPSSSNRYIKYQSTGLAETTDNELILDNQLGLPIDLIEMNDYFGEGRQYQQQQQQQQQIGAGSLDQTDEMLLMVPIKAAPGSAAANAIANSNGGPGAGSGVSMAGRSRLPAVSWLRRTEYISNETPTGAGKGANKESGSAKRKIINVDSSREGQIGAIEKTFSRFLKKSSRGTMTSLSEEEILAGLRHPTKPDVKAVETLPIYPDFGIWGNAYVLVTFDVDPEMTNDHRVQSEGSSRHETAQRSSNALIKPASNVDEPEPWLGYYLPDTETAREINRRKRSRTQGELAIQDEVDDDKELSFSLQRDYTYTTIPCAPLSQLVFTFRDQPESKHRAAFYNPMQSKLMLRKKRSKPYDDDEPPISDFDVTVRRMNSDELAAKRDALDAIGL
ncbi:hypothetical protein BGW38_000774 [Lunasporangiospora selenospora]|uniref:Uncharacterized protein n=1 Tax=Lunasporangiospora selenospora TaxID=979761 RepID=A0A9P6KEQ8_9FUNG|nr:hypothetical protein BGW38_000774 [Lunasporangiospora selenospora]